MTNIENFQLPKENHSEESDTLALLPEPIIPELRITYFTDPICIWSWAFEPHWIRLIESIGSQVTFRFRMGGLIYPEEHNTRNPYTSQDAISGLCADVEEKTGVELSDKVWKIHDVQSTYPACISFHSAVEEGLEKQILFLRRIRQAYLLFGNYFMIESDFYRILEEIDLDKESFHYYWQSGIAYKEFMVSLAGNNIYGIHSFPSLMADEPGKTPLFVHGYHHFHRLKLMISNAFPKLVWYPVPALDYILALYQPLTSYEIIQLYDLTPDNLKDFLMSEKIKPLIKKVNGIDLYFHPQKKSKIKI